MNTERFEELLRTNVEVFKLIFFFEDNCLVCTEVMRVVERIAEDFKGKALLVGKINMSKNEVPEMIGYEFPLLAVLRSFLDTGSSTYHGNWEYEDVKTWLEKAV